MISLGIYDHQSLYENILRSGHKIQIERIDKLTNLKSLSKFDLLLINISELEEEESISFSKKLSELTRTKIIFVNDNYTFKQVKSLMFFGVYDCLKLPVHTPDLISLLEQACSELDREMKRNRKIEMYTINSIRESLAYDLLHGKVKNAKEIWERSQLANLSLIPNTVLLLSIDNFSKLVQNKGELWKSSLREEVLSAINQCDLDYEAVKVIVDQEKYAILLSLPVQLEEEKYKELATEYAEEIREKINEKTDYTVTIGIGNYYEDARNLHLSYQESEYAQAYRLFSMENSIIHVEDLDYYETPEYYEYKIQIQEMTNKFSLGDITAVHKQWEEIYHSVATHHNFQPEEFRLQVLDLLFSLSKSSIQNGANPKNILPLQIKHAKELHDIESLTEIDKWMKEIIQEFFSYVNEGHNEQLLKSVQEVLRYLEEHYHEDIGLEIIAEKVGLSPNYLSSIFKQTIGSSFIEYITDLRIKKAKEKLHDLNLSVYEIAESIGYSSSQYFSRVFKNNVGMTPSAYRNSLLTTKKW